MKPYYELHITYLDFEGSATPYFPGWSPSAIAGDIILGEGRKHYLTKHAHRDAELDQLASGMEIIATSLRERGLKVLRTKIELVLYDRRTVA